jgi:Amt family ammonium transporter
MGRHSVMRSVLSLAAVLVLLAIPFVGMAQEDGAAPPAEVPAAEAPAEPAAAAPAPTVDTGDTAWVLTSTRWSCS